MTLGIGQSQMFASAKLSGEPGWVKPEGCWKRETDSGEPETSDLRTHAGAKLLRVDLNYSNRPVRTRMPGGVGGVGQVS